MREITELEELQKIETDILAWFDLFCKEHDLSYFMCGGTLIGAVRHKGFIPWDDDIDVAMLSKDYDRLIEIMKTENNGRYKFLCHELFRNYLYPYAKIVDTKTVINENNRDFGYKLGVYIDVFPYANETDDTEERKQRHKRHQRLDKWLTYATIKNHSGNHGIKSIAYKGIDIAVKIYSRERITDKWVEFTREYDGRETSLISSSWFYLESEVLPKAYYSETVDLVFEGHHFSAPKGYHEYLTSRYGNYMKLPPEEERVPKHEFDAFLL